MLPGSIAARLKHVSSHSLSTAIGEVMEHYDRFSEQSAKLDQHLEDESVVSFTRMSEDIPTWFPGFDLQLGQQGRKAFLHVIRLQYHKHQNECLNILKGYNPPSSISRLPFYSVKDLWSLAWKIDRVFPGFWKTALKIHEAYGKPPPGKASSSRSEQEYTVEDATSPRVKREASGGDRVTVTSIEEDYTCDSKKVDGVFDSVLPQEVGGSGRKSPVNRPADSSQEVWDDSRLHASPEAVSKTCFSAHRKCKEVSKSSDDACSTKTESLSVQSIEGTNSIASESIANNERAACVQGVPEKVYRVDDDASSLFAPVDLEIFLHSIGEAREFHLGDSVADSGASDTLSASCGEHDLSAVESGVDKAYCLPVADDNRNLSYLHPTVELNSSFPPSGAGFTHGEGKKRASLCYPSKARVENRGLRQPRRAISVSYPVIDGVSLGIPGVEGGSVRTHRLTGPHREAVKRLSPSKLSKKKKKKKKFFKSQRANSELSACVSLYNRRSSECNLADEVKPSSVAFETTRCVGKANSTESLSPKMIISAEDEILSGCVFDDLGSPKNEDVGAVPEDLLIKNSEVTDTINEKVVDRLRAFPIVHADSLAQANRDTRKATEKSRLIQERKLAKITQKLRKSDESPAFLSEILDITGSLPRDLDGGVLRSEKTFSDNRSSQAVGGTIEAPISGSCGNLHRSKPTFSSYQKTSKGCGKTSSSLAGGVDSKFYSSSLTHKAEFFSGVLNVPRKGDECAVRRNKPFGKKKRAENMSIQYANPPQSSVCIKQDTSASLLPHGSSITESLLLSSEDPMYDASLDSLKKNVSLSCQAISNPFNNKRGCSRSGDKISHYCGSENLSASTPVELNFSPASGEDGVELEPVDIGFQPLKNLHEKAMYRPIESCYNAVAKSTSVAEDSNLSTGRLSGYPLSNPLDSKLFRGKGLSDSPCLELLGVAECTAASKDAASMLEKTGFNTNCKAGQLNSSTQDEGHGETDELASVLSKEDSLEACKARTTKDAEGLSRCVITNRQGVKANDDECFEICNGSYSSSEDSKSRNSMLDSHSVGKSLSLVQTATPERKCSSMRMKESSLVTSGKSCELNSSSGEEEDLHNGDEGFDWKSEQKLRQGARSNKEKLHHYVFSKKKKLHQFLESTLASADMDILGDNSLDSEGSNLDDVSAKEYSIRNALRSPIRRKNKNRYRASAQKKSHSLQPSTDTRNGFAESPIFQSTRNAISAAHSSDIQYDALFEDSFLEDCVSTNSSNLHGNSPRLTTDTSYFVDTFSLHEKTPPSHCSSPRVAANYSLDDFSLPERAPDSSYFSCSRVAANSPSLSNYTHRFLESPERSEQIHYRQRQLSDLSEKSPLRLTKFRRLDYFETGENNSCSDSEDCEISSKSSPFTPVQATSPFRPCGDIEDAILGDKTNMADSNVVALDILKQLAQGYNLKEQRLLSSIESASLESFVDITSRRNVNSSGDPKDFHAEGGVGIDSLSYEDDTTIGSFTSPVSPACSTDSSHPCLEQSINLGSLFGGLEQDQKESMYSCGGYFFGERVPEGLECVRDICQKSWEIAELSSGCCVNGKLECVSSVSEKSWEIAGLSSQCCVNDTYESIVPKFEQFTAVEKKSSETSMGDEWLQSQDSLERRQKINSSDSFIIEAESASSSVQCSFASAKATKTIPHAFFEGHLSPLLGLSGDWKESTLLSLLSDTSSENTAEIHATPTKKENSSLPIVRIEFGEELNALLAQNDGAKIVDLRDTRASADECSMIVIPCIISPNLSIN